MTNFLYIQCILYIKEFKLSSFPSLTIIVFRRLTKTLLFYYKKLCVFNLIYSPCKLFSQKNVLQFQIHHDSKRISFRNYVPHMIQSSFFLALLRNFSLFCTTLMSQFYDIFTLSIEIFPSPTYEFKKKHTFSVNVMIAKKQFAHSKCTFGLC